MKDFIESHTYYFSEAFDIGALIEKARFALKDVDFDTFVARGLSGTLVAPALARNMGKHFLIVRKEDGSHSSNRCEGRLGERWVFVDDFINSGRTRDACKEEVARLAESRCFRTVFVGSYCYHNESPPFKAARSPYGFAGIPSREVRV